MGLIALPALPLRAADDKKEEEAPKGSIDEVTIGEVIANGPLTKDDLKGKVVVVELWGIN